MSAPRARASLPAALALLFLSGQMLLTDAAGERVIARTRASHAATPPRAHPRAGARTPRSNSRSRSCRCHRQCHATGRRRCLRDHRRLLRRSGATHGAAVKAPASNARGTGLEPALSPPVSGAGGSPSAGAGSSSPAAGGTPPTEASSTSTAPAHVQVLAREYSLTLSRAEVPAGKVVVEFVNGGEDPHNLHLEEPAAGTEAGAFGTSAPKTHADLALELRPGSYTLFCSLPEHEAKGMKATLLVR